MCLSSTQKKRKKKHSHYGISTDSHKNACSSVRRTYDERRFSASCTLDVDHKSITPLDSSEDKFSGPSDSDKEVYDTIQQN